MKEHDTTLDQFEMDKALFFCDRVKNVKAVVSKYITHQDTPHSYLDIGKRMTLKSINNIR